jgi:hypothetical protein
MATKDFKSSRIRLNKIISVPDSAISPEMLIYSSTSQGVDDIGGLSSSITQNVSDDTFLFVSGTIGSAKVAGSRGTSTFGGDVVISGSLYVEQQTNLKAEHVRYLESPLEDDGQGNIFPSTDLRSSDNSCILFETNEVLAFDLVDGTGEKSLFEINLKLTDREDFVDKYFEIDPDNPGSVMLKENFEDTITEYLELKSFN